MKKVLILFGIFIGTFIFSQINVKEIKKNIIEDSKKYYYENLKIFKTDPKILTQEQLNYIYYGNNFVDYGYNRIEFNKKLGAVTKFANRKISKKLAKKILKDALNLYEINPINKEILLDLVNIYDSLEEHSKSELHELQYQLLIETIRDSGTGKLEEYPIVVTNISDQMMAVEKFSNIFTHGIDFESKVLPDGSWLNIYKNGLNLYFVKTIHHKDMFGDD